MRPEIADVCPNEGPLLFAQRSEEPPAVDPRLVTVSEAQSARRSREEERIEAFRHCCSAVVTALRLRLTAVLERTHSLDSVVADGLNLGDVDVGLSMNELREGGWGKLVYSERNSISSFSDNDNPTKSLPFAKSRSISPFSHQGPRARGLQRTGFRRGAAPRGGGSRTRHRTKRRGPVLHGGNDEERKPVRKSKCSDPHWGICSGWWGGWLALSDFFSLSSVTWCSFPKGDFGSSFIPEDSVEEVHRPSIQ